MSVLQIASLLLVLAGLFGAVNHVLLRLPTAIGILVVSLVASVVILGIDALSPELAIGPAVREQVNALDFSDSLLEGMLGLLLFAGALHVKLRDLRENWRIVLLMATLGVALSTAVIGYGFAWITGAPILIALVFGAIVTPTDPVAVLGVLKDAGLRRSLESKIAGESLFNDGVAYVVFLLLVGLAFPGGDAHGGEHAGGVSAVEAAAILFVQEAMGGAVLGLGLGFLTYRIMRRIDDYSLEVLLTLALAFGGYQLAVLLHVSAPIMAVCAGLLIGDAKHRLSGVSEDGKTYLDAFWKLIDEILNAVLFLMIGVEVFAVAFEFDFVVAGVLSIGLALLGRLAAVAIPVAILKPFRGFSKGVVPIMTWGGIKGGISIALALSLPTNEWTPLILTATYMVVLFSILVQGLTVTRVAARYGAEPDPL